MNIGFVLFHCKLKKSEEDTNFGLA